LPILPDDVSLNKASIIERSIRRFREEYTADPDLINYTHIDAMTLNVERACQAAIDLAFHLVAQEHLGMPKNSADGFHLLYSKGLISEISTKSMIAMTGFRNVAIHEYQQLDLSILRAIAETHWHTLVVFCRELGMTIKP